MILGNSISSYSVVSRIDQTVINQSSSQEFWINLGLQGKLQFWPFLTFHQPEFMIVTTN